MTDLTISLICFGCILGGVLFGLLLQTHLPEHHLSKDSQDTVKLGAGMVATMAALVLGLLVSSAKESFDSMNSGVAQSGAKIVLIDHLLADYGPETRAAREQLKSALIERIAKVWPTEKTAMSGLRAAESFNGMNVFNARLRQLSPKDATQKSLLAEVQQASLELRQNRLLMVEEQQEALPSALIVLLVFWLGLLFTTFGLFAPRNGTVFVVLLVCSLAVSSAVFLILEMSHPLEGVIKVSSAPLVKALELIGN